MLAWGRNMFAPTTQGYCAGTFSRFSTLRRSVRARFGPFWPPQGLGRARGLRDARPPTAVRNRNVFGVLHLYAAGIERTLRLYAAGIERPLRFCAARIQRTTFQSIHFHL